LSLNNNLRELTPAEINLIGGGYIDQFVIPDPIFVWPISPYPLGDVNPPGPKPYWDNKVNPAFGIPTPEPALPKIGFP